MDTDFPVRYEVWGNNKGIDLRPASDEYSWGDAIYGVTKVNDDIREEIDNRKNGLFGVIEFEHKKGEGIKTPLEYEWVEGPFDDPK